LAKGLRRAAGDRPPDDPLLPDVPRHDRRFTATVERAGLDPNLTAYCLRHSSIVRMLLACVPTRIVAAHHDTSVQQIEKHYAAYILGDPSDAITRRALLDLGAPPVGNVVSLTRVG
jgi:integrase